jgi:Raf kinase inhibitor-like YbhB/YbcL family protein
MTNGTPLRIASSSFADNGAIPRQFTCDGDNINPPLSISGITEEAKSLVLIVEDPDIPTEVREKLNLNVFDHWVVFNIPVSPPPAGRAGAGRRPTTNNIQEGSAPGTEGQNSSGKVGYTGPCPPPQYQPTEHRYFFKIYALDTELVLSGGATKEEVEKAMEGHIIAQDEIVGRYDRAK